MLGRCRGRLLGVPCARRNNWWHTWLLCADGNELPGTRPQLHPTSESGRCDRTVARGWRSTGHYKSEAVGSRIHSTADRAGVPARQIGQTAKRNGQISSEDCPIPWWSNRIQRNFPRDLHAQGQREKHDQDSDPRLVWLQWHQAGGWSTISLIARCGHGADAEARRPRGTANPWKVALRRRPAATSHWWCWLFQRHQ